MATHIKPDIIIGKADESEVDEEEVLRFLDLFLPWLESIGWECCGTFGLDEEE